MTDLVQLEAKPAKHFLYDSMPKMIGVFFASITKEPITFAGTTLQPQPLVVSPNVFRGFTCPEGCGACCGRATLDYIPGEPKPEFTEERMIEVNGRQIKIYSDMQMDNNNFFCRHLSDNTARCETYATRPFSCDFALLNINHYRTHYLLSCRKFGRHHLWKRIDGERGTLCEMLEINDQHIEDTRRRLARLATWIHYFQIDSWIDDVNKWAAQDPYKIKEPLRLGF